MSEIIEAFYDKRKVYIPLEEKLIDLRERGFGSLEKEKLILSPYEIFFLVDKGRIKVIDKKIGQKLSLKELVEKFSVRKPASWIKYLVYRDLRDRGYIVREIDTVDFEIYGKGVTRRFIYIIYEGSEANIKELNNLLKFAVQERKELIIAVIDRRTDLVYYSLTELVV
jgi:tRNA-intron endonuclease